MSANHANDQPEMQDIPDALHTLHRTLLQGGATWRETLPATDRLAQQVRVLTHTASAAEPTQSPTPSFAPAPNGDVSPQPIVGAQPRRRFPPFVNTLGAAVVVVLLVSAFAWLQFGTRTVTPGGITPTATASGIPAHPLAQSQSVNGVTVYIADVYADATRTLLHFFVKGGATIIPRCPEIYTLADEVGHPVSILDGSGNSVGIGSYECFATLTPFPVTDIGTQQTLTFTAQSLSVIGATYGTPETRVSGPWQASFAYAIVAAHSGNSLALPVTKSTITMQIGAVQWSHVAKQFDGNAGGARVILHLSGLPPNHHNVEFEIATHISESFGDSSGSDGDGGASHFTLSGPWGTSLQPAIAASLSPTTTRRSANIGPDGATDIEVTFLIPNLPNRGTANLMLDTLVISTKAGDVHAPLLTFSGPWDFAIPIA